MGPCVIAGNKQGKLNRDGYRCHQEVDLRDVCFLYICCFFGGPWIAKKELRMLELVLVFCVVCN